MSGTYVQAIGTSLSRSVTHVRDLPEAAFFDRARRASFENLGIETVAVDPRSAAELAREASLAALDAAGVAPSELDVVILVEPRVPERFACSEATRLQHAIAATNAWSFGLSDLGCATVDGAIAVAKALLDSRPELLNVLVAHGSKPFTDERYRHPVTILGDGGGAVVLGRAGPPLVRHVDDATR